MPDTGIVFDMSDRIQTLDAPCFADFLGTADFMSLPCFANFLGTKRFLESARTLRDSSARKTGRTASWAAGTPLQWPQDLQHLHPLEYHDCQFLP